MPESVIVTKDSKKYKTLITNIGNEKIARAALMGEKVNIVRAIVTDGGGQYFVPTADMTALPGEVWQGEIASKIIDPTSRNIIDVRVFLDGSVGGFTVRGVGLLDNEGDLIAVGNMPDTEKAMIADGVAATLTIVMKLLVTNVDALDIVVNPNVDTVTPAELEEALGRTTEDIMERVDEKIASSGKFVGLNFSLTIPVTGWTADEDTNGAYPLHLDILNAEIAEDMVPVLSILPECLKVAADCELCPTARTLPGILRLYAKAAPAEELNASLTLLGSVRECKEITIPVTGWTAAAGGGEYPLVLDIPGESITADLIPMLAILPECLKTASDCGLSSSVETLDGALRLRAKTAPEASIIASLALIQNTRVSSGGFGGSIGHGLKMENGALTVDTVDDFKGDNTLPITAAGVETIVGDTEALLKTI